ncbi:rho GTPase-activating protein 11A [Thalassophryne amazonica]|uniref:rho GTPase-activating protein 11A n=1 Tax=Thalassophryne amazonica TaxID=390379 RepID=UPI0014710106|nr:rho GTPase-activating protein 11A [Thalassophryne amazonica]
MIECRLLSGIKMKIVERNVMRLVAVQQLRASYGIKTKNWNKNKAASSKTTANTPAKVFGVPLETLPQYHMDCGSVPRFLVDACMNLLAHVDTEGLFRKSGSVVRLKGLRAKLDLGEECLSRALPCDVASLVKQFFRELPEPVLPAELQEAFLKAQQLAAEEERTAATMLLSCVLPDLNLSTLSHFFQFLHSVSKRSAMNKMDSSNLSVILAPNLLHCFDAAEKMNAATEKRLRLQAAVIHRLIENAHHFGILPPFLREKVLAMMGREVGDPSPTTYQDPEELDQSSGTTRRRRRSFGDVVNVALNKIKTNRTPTNGSQSDCAAFSSATPVIATPTLKRKLPLDSGPTFGFSSKKRRSVKKNLGIELLPNILFSGNSTPGSAYSASEVLESQNAPVSVGRSRRQSATSVRKKSRRLGSRHVINRVESGRAGCFSPKVNKKEAPRKSLRLRFSVGKSSKDTGSESIGRRLATQESTATFTFTNDANFSPSDPQRKCSKYISKSENDLLTPQHGSSAHRVSWSGTTPEGVQAFSGGSFTDTPMTRPLKSSYLSEPAIVVSKPPTASSLPMKLCCASSAESLECSASEAQNQISQPMNLKAHTEAGDDLPGVKTTKPADRVTSAETPAVRPLSGEAFRVLAAEQNITFSHFDVAVLSPLHINSTVFDSVCCSPVKATNDTDNSSLEESDQDSEQMSCSRLIDALDIQSPAHFKMGVSSGLQSTPYKPVSKLCNLLPTPPEASMLHASDELDTKVQTQETIAPHRLQTQKLRVADHIQHFNKLTLRSPQTSEAKLIRPPLKFERTPVRQTVCRINSLMGDNRRPTKNTEPTAIQKVVKTVSLESGLSPRLSSGIKKPPPVPPKKCNTLTRKASVLGDVTNKVSPKTKVDSGAFAPLGARKAQQVAQYYRGSPRNPLHQGRLLSATKPVNL